MTGSEFYGPDGSYRMFVGKDVSVALAMMSFSPEYFNSYNKVKKIILVRAKLKIDRNSERLVQ